MVQIVIKLIKDAKEWVIVELQGFLETDHDELAGIHIGDLHFDERGIPNLIIGHHVLQGKAAALEKPFAVMKKKVKIEEGDGEMMDVSDKPCKTETSYDVVALVKRKIIFKNRPRPIIVKPQAKTP